MSVKRIHNKTVTTHKIRLPILVPADAKTNEGRATFLQEIGPPVSVRALRDEDISHVEKHLEEWEIQHFKAVVAIAQELAARPGDPLALKAAMESLRAAEELQPSRLLEGIDADTIRRVRAALAHLTGLPSQEAIAHFEGIVPGRRARQDPHHLLSYELSKGLDEAKLVLWWDGKSLVPAFWCPTIKVALYVRALFSKGLRICAHCSEPFVPVRPDQEYCSVQHREAHRVARWRLQKKHQVTERKGSSGSRKAR